MPYFSISGMSSEDQNIPTILTPEEGQIAVQLLLLLYIECYRLEQEAVNQRMARNMSYMTYIVLLLIYSRR